MKDILRKWSAVVTLSLVLQIGVGSGSLPITFANSSVQSPVLTTSGGLTAFTSGDNATATPVAIDTSLTISDPDSATLASGIVAITGNYHAGEDVLAFTNTSSATYGNITASYNSGTGVLTLTSSGATATVAQWQNAMRSVTYTNLAVMPNTSARTISFTVSNGSASSSSAVKTVTVTTANQTPILTTSGGLTAFTSGDNATATPVAIDTSLTISDPDSATLASGIVAITGNYHAGEDVLAFTNTSSATYGNITASYNSGTGVLTLTSSGATATVAQWQNAMRSVTYTNLAVMPNTSARTISFTVSDGSASSSSAVKTVTVTTVNQTPILTTSGGLTAFTRGDNATATPVAIDTGLTISDLDNTTLASGIVAITGNYHAGEDVLAFVNTSATTYGNIVASYNSGTGVLTLTSSGATATVAQWQNAMRSVTYTNLAVMPNTSARTISFTVSDGSASSSSAVKTVTVTAANQTPILTTSGGSTAFMSGDNATATPVAIDTGLTISDLDNTTLASGTVAITGNYHAGEDVLAFANVSTTTYGNITASYNSASGVLTLTSSGATATVAQWQAAMRSVTYTNTVVTPNTSARTISFTVNDGLASSSSGTKVVTVTAANQAPILTTSGGSTAFMSGDNATATPVAIDIGLTISDLDSATLASGMVSITGNFHVGEDVLAFANVSTTTYGNITASYNSASGVLTLVSSGATATVAQWQNAMRSVTYTNSAVMPNTSARTISFTVNDGLASSSSGTKVVTVTAANQAPILTTSGGSTAFTSGDNATATPVAIDTGLTISDLDNTTLASGIVAITGNYHAGEDVLAFANTSATTYGNIVASYDSGTGVLTLTSSGATATVVQWQAAMRSVTYTNSAVMPNTSARTISFTVNDGLASSSNGTKVVTVTAANQAPVLTTSDGSTAFTANNNTTSTPVAIDTGLTISDLDNTTLASGIVAITGNFHAGEDVLAFTNTSSTTYGNIVASYNSGTGELTLTSSGATATVAQWQAAMRSVTYTNSAVTPNTSARTISFTVSDGLASSSSTVKSVTLKALKSLTANPQTISVLAGQTATAAIMAMYSDQSQSDVTSSVYWTVQTPEIASVSGGTITGLWPGNTVLIAVYGTQSVEISLTVEWRSSSRRSSSSSVTNPTDTNPVTPTTDPDPAKPPAEKVSVFNGLVDVDHLIASIQSSLGTGNFTAFKDVASHWAYNDITLASKLGIINGFQDDSFRPDTSITRAEFSTLIVKAFALHLGGGTSTFPDIQTSWARESIGILASNGVINGYPDGMFRPDSRITRAEMVAIISRIAILKESSPGKDNTFVDVAPQHWANNIINNIAAAGIIQGKDQNSFAPDDNLTRAEALTVIMRMLRKEPTVKNLLG